MTTLQDDLTALAVRSSASPELLYEAILATADEVERQGISPFSVADMRRTAKAVKPMIGMAADEAWKEQSRRDKFRNRERESEWKDEYTETLISEAKSTVQAVIFALR